ncbi:MAG: hypothetical protein PHI66_02850 [Candidatus Pacebacteria bacterium]|nr:hypothetical protein [Candidatus Paceibacterota bacterium]
MRYIFLSFCLLMCVISVVFVSPVAAGEGYINEVRVNDEEVDENEVILLLSGDRTVITVEVDNLKNFSVFLEDAQDIFKDGDIQYSGDKCTIFAKNIEGLSKEGEILINVINDDTKSRVSQFTLAYHLVKYESLDYEIVIEEPSSDSVDEGWVDFSILIEGITKEERDLIGLKCSCVITSSRLEEPITFDGFERRIKLLSDSYEFKVTLTDKFQKSQSEEFPLIVLDSEPGNDVFINYSQTNNIAIVNAPFLIDLSGSYADVDTFFYIFVNGEQVGKLTYLQGRKNNMVFEYTFDSPGTYNIKIVVGEMKEEFAKKTFEVEALVSGAVSGIEEVSAKTEEYTQPEKTEGGGLLGHGAISSEELKALEEQKRKIESENKQVPGLGFPHILAVLFLTARILKRKLLEVL